MTSCRKSCGVCSPDLEKKGKLLTLVKKQTQDQQL